MTRPGARLSAAVWRLAVGMLALVVAGLMVPAVASATPESDADAAVTAAWEASGGDGGPLGPRQGGVYAAGSGFAQNFAGGKMFFTPATGAHFMQGAILEKYESLGGPAEGDLGFPTIDEGAGRAPDSRNSTLSAPDNPVIFWTPSTGARVVRGAINAAWDKLGGSAGVLGVPAEDESFDGDVNSQKFTGGEISWNRKTKAFTTVPPELADQLAGLDIPSDPAAAIAAARRAAGGAMGPLGAKDGDQYPIGDGGFGQNYAGGKIFYTPATGANAITGQLLEKYESVGGPEGDLGFPTASESEGGLGPNSRISTFAAADNPVIFWTPDYGAVIVRGAMKAAWDKLGGAKGALGAPMADQTEDGTVISQRFSGGAISWDRDANTFTTEPSKLASELSGLEVPGVGQPHATGPQPSGPDTKKPFSWHWSWWWLIAVVPVLLLAGLIVGAALWHRRRAGDDDDFDHDPFDDDYDGGPGEPRYDEGGYDDARYESRGYDDEFGDERGAREAGYAPSSVYGAGEATTARFAGPGEESAGGAAASPYDGPTDIAMPVSQWAAPHGSPGGYGAPGEEDEPPEDSSQLAGPEPQQRYDRYEDDGYQDDDFDDDDDFEEDDFEDDDFDEDEDPDAPIDADFEEVAEGDDTEGEIEAELADEDLTDTRALASPAGGVREAAGFAAAGLAVPSDQDNVDTAPTRVITEAEAYSSSQAYSNEAYSSEAHSGRHAAIELDEIPSATAIHLPLDDPNRAPEGYPIKADTKSGRYWAPDSSEYDDATAEIWFASEEFARTNGFVRAD
ncbi:LGFP repeat-containing protein [Mycolicibacterium nivoides]|uniref:LGFP repeat-containing protein n=1 Tax=Mycolicibacterium nivoides TaxID=2487344 RepID=UPI003C306F2F